MAFSFDNLLDSVIPAIISGGGTAISTIYAFFRDLKKRVEELAGAHVELSTATDPTLLGGLRVRIGDLQIDASVSGRLERLRARLVQGTS